MEEKKDKNGDNPLVQVLITDLNKQLDALEKMLPSNKHTEERFGTCKIKLQALQLSDSSNYADNLKSMISSWQAIQDDIDGQYSTAPLKALAFGFGCALLLFSAMLLTAPELALMGAALLPIALGIMIASVYYYPGSLRGYDGVVVEKIKLFAENTRDSICCDGPHWSEVHHVHATHKTPAK